MVAVIAAVVAATVVGRLATDTAPAARPALSGTGVSVAPPDLEPAPISYRFLSTPDFMNADIADLRDYRGWRRAHRHYRGKLPNSWNSSYAKLVDTIMNRFMYEKPEDVLVAGDLVSGHWGRDNQKTGIFGPVGARRQQKRAVDRAAKVYFRAYRHLFSSRGLNLRPAMGDHEYGDNPWASTAEYGPLKLATMKLIKARFDAIFHSPYRYTSRPLGPAHRTAYATRLAPEVLLVTLDEFQKGRTDVTGKLDDQQLAWLDQELADADRRDTDWVIVQGHLPIIPNVRTKSSSAMCYDGGTSSALWRTLVKHKVDLYLNGEVHSNTAHHVDGVTQISHGGTIGAAAPHSIGNTSYLVGDITGDQLDLRLMRFRTTYADRSKRLWETGGLGPVVRKHVSPVPDLIGTMRLAKDQELLDRSGELGPYDGPVSCKTGG
jgi:hypothetical protein